MRTFLWKITRATNRLFFVERANGTKNGES